MMKQPKLYVFASNNAHKLEEVRRILSPREIHSLHEIGFEAEIDETGTTLEENSSIKARAIYDWLKQKGKLGGQHKIPRLSNKRDYIEQILALNE